MGTAIPKTSERKKSHYLLQLFDQRYAQQTPCRGRYTSRKMFQQIVKSLAEKEKCYRESENQRYDVMGSEDE